MVDNADVCIYKASESVETNIPLELLIPCMIYLKRLRGLLSSLSHSLSPVGPQLAGNVLDELELCEHLLLSHSLGTVAGRGKATLWGNADALHGLLSSPALALGDDVGGLEHLPLHVGCVLQVGNLGADDTENDVLVLGEEAEGLEATATLVVVLEVESVVVEISEETLGDLLV